VKEKELDAADPAVKSVKVQDPTGGQGMIPLPPFRIEPPPSANTSKRGGRFCAPAQGEIINRGRIHGTGIRIARMPLLSNI
jgi:hypothetical protein